ncbi:hypothetical protein Murru_1311 [Allomuricauda ruestringensis DSM 13258]|uniref:Uncharacterized protein n=2 Tax=Flagellimonas TaxID=444459 RepID=G2PPA1_ALLRU|nr:hypothetical protein Murru_1311 [Allomuricauda ruestringensis DSM 13258]
MIQNDYSLVLDDDEIWVEQFDSTNLDTSRYNHNNIVFKENISFIYSFKHFTKDNQRLSFKYIDSISDWKFVPYSNKKDGLFEKVSITVMKGLEPMLRGLPDYNQTVLSYSYLTHNDFAPYGSTSGVIENEKNIWMHPPRDKYFKILELNPFPYIKAPYKVGNTWAWSLSIGDIWSDSRWLAWNGIVENSYEYEIIKKSRLDTFFGNLKCFVIRSKATSRLGETKLTSYFHKKYGFVRLDYQNIDGSRTVLELIDIVNLNKSLN